MLTFNDESFTVKVKASSPHEDWLSTMHDIIDALSGIDENFRAENNYYFLCNLLKEMLPDEKMAKKMITD